MKLNRVFLLAPLAAGACVTADPEVETEVSEIRNSTQLADAYYRDRAAVLLNNEDKPTCTATRISANYLLTALHCDPWVNQRVAFYSSSTAYDGARDALVAEVIIQSGTNPDDCENVDGDGCYASDGQFADIALVRIKDGRGDLDSEGPAATMAWKFPGDGVVGTKVGAGQHVGEPNTTGRLLQVADNISDDGDADGRFDTGDDDTDDGDSGGPFYVSNKVAGVLNGWVDFGLNDYNIYTSVPEHLPWILSEMGFRWRGLTARTSTKYTGSTVDSFHTTSERVCQYACEKSTSCDAYNFLPQQAYFIPACELKTNITGASTSSGWKASLKHGNRSGASNDVVGYARSDGWDAAVHRATNQRIHELYQNGSTSWEVADIHGNAPLAESDVSAYARSDGFNAVVYRSTGDEIIELKLDGTWTSASLTAVGGGGVPYGDPMAYVRADGVNAVVYRGTNGYIYELARGLGGWNARNLTTSAGSAILAHTDPSAFARADGYSSVVFRSGSSVYELYRGSSGNWAIGNLTSLAGGAPAAQSRPFGFRHEDGTTAVVYRTTSNRLVELWLDGAGWHWNYLTTAIIHGDPVAYLRTDGTEAVIARNASNQIIEIANAPWAAYNLHNIVGMTSGAITDAAVFVRNDGYNTVLFETSDNRVREMTWKPGTSWGWNDISLIAGETP